MMGVILKAPLYKSYKYLGWPKVKPLSITVSVTRRCNSRCLTCNVWKDRPGEELDVEEYEKVFKSIGKAPFYITFSGGEPFLRRDFAEICKTACDICGPSVITIPTNGILSERIPAAIDEIAGDCRRARIILNLSLDGLGERHDEIRGVPGCFQKVMSTFEGLKRLRRPNLQLGFHTVISRHNVHEIPAIYEFAMSAGADSYVTEIAEERVELGTVGSDIAPDGKDYAAAVEYITEAAGRAGAKGFPRIIRALRKRYYRYVMDIVSGKDAWMPCYAGIASGQINFNGDVWFCCIKGEPVGNLREAGYDFGRIWFGEKADAERKRITDEKCRCPMANAFYTNIIMNPSKLIG